MGPACYIDGLCFFFPCHLYEVTDQVFARIGLENADQYVIVGSTMHLQHRACVDVQEIISTHKPMESDTGIQRVRGIASVELEFLVFKQARSHGSVVQRVKLVNPWTANNHMEKKYWSTFFCFLFLRFICFFLFLFLLSFPCFSLCLVLSFHLALFLSCFLSLLLLF